MQTIVNIDFLYESTLTFMYSIHMRGCLVNAALSKTNDVFYFGINIVA